MFTAPFSYLATPAGGLPDIYIGSNLDQWLAPEIATSTSEYLIDQSGNARNATLGGTEWVWNGGNYLEITSGTSTSNVVNLGYKPDMSNAFSYQVWVYVEDTTGEAGPGDNDCGILHNLTTGNSANSFSFRARSVDRTVTFMRAGGGAIFNNTQNGTWDNWICYTFTYLLDAGTSDCRLYEGTNLVQETLGGPAMSSGQDTQMYLAGIFDGNTTNYFEKVRYGAYRVYSEELSSANITTNYNAEKAHYGL